MHQSGHQQVLEYSQPVYSMALATQSFSLLELALVLEVYLSPLSASFEELQVMPTSPVLSMLGSDLFRLLLPRVPLAQLLLSLQPLLLTV